MRTENFEIGADVFCEGTTCGRLTAVAIKRASARLAHLIVDPGHGGEPRLVHAAQAHAADRGIRLDCTRQQFEALEPAVIAHLEPSEPSGPSGSSEPTTGPDEERRWRRHDEISSWPAFGLGPTLNPSIGTPAPPPTRRPHLEFEDRIPADELSFHKNLGIHAADGDIGHLAGVGVEPADKRLTQILVDEGHLWGHKRVAVPMRLVRQLDDEGIMVRLSKRQIKDLPPIARSI